MNTTDFLEIANAICPDRFLTIFEGNKWTYSQANERINRLANGLVELGIKKGDRIGIVQVNCNQFPEIYFASAKLGAIFVPINFRAKADELSYMISNAGVNILFAGNRYMDILNQIRPEIKDVREYITLEEKVEGAVFYNE